MENQPGPPSLHPLLAGRWSPARLDASYVLAEADLDMLVEAARWAPSAGNSQPGRRRHRVARLL